MVRQFINGECKYNQAEEELVHSMKSEKQAKKESFSKKPLVYISGKYGQGYFYPQMCDTRQ